jgi:hypothetical protein
MKPKFWGDEFLVNFTTKGSQFDPSVTGLVSGRFVVVWADDSQTGLDTSGSAVKGQVFNAGGSSLGAEFRINTTVLNSQNDPAVADLTDGRFVVVWTDSSKTGGDISSLAVRGQIYNANGTKSGGEFLVNTTTPGAQAEPTIALLSNGGFVVAWRDESQSEPTRHLALSAPRCST